MSQSRFFLNVLRVPLAWKIAGANALLTIALAVVFSLLPSAHPDWAASSGLALMVILAAAAVNVILINLALKPIRDLERAAELLWSGETNVNVPSSLLADRDLRRVARTVDALLERLASERARLQQLTTQLIEARASERSAIARELTESVAQSATGLALECASLKSDGAAGDAERFGRMAQTAMSLVEEIRRIARDVHPRHIDQLGLDVALRSLAREAQTVKSRVNYSSSGLPATAENVPREIAGALYDVTREALKNARCHSGASEVNVSLGVKRHAVSLRVSDNGSGFNSVALDLAHCPGLNTMREGIALVGGSLEINSPPGGGTEIVAIVPLVHPTPRELPSRDTTHREELATW